jgi:Mg2+ and Co2+ transporter CorA
LYNKVDKVGELNAYVYVILALQAAVILFLARFLRANKHTNRADNNQADPNSHQSKDRAGRYDTSALMDILRDQLAHSREDVSELQEAVERLTEQIAGMRHEFLLHLLSASKEQKIDMGRTENELGRINNRLENYRLLLSQLEENTRGRS